MVNYPFVAALDSSVPERTTANMGLAWAAILPDSFGEAHIRFETSNFVSRIQRKLLSLGGCHCGASACHRCHARMIARRHGSTIYTARGYVCADSKYDDGLAREGQRMVALVS